MCGIVGCWYFVARPDRLALQSDVVNMAQSLVHRGPDGDGHWVDSQIGLALAHRRLSVVDLSSTGVQPMASADCRYVISYNGEIYNFRELAKELKSRGHQFRGTSDTEVILEGCSAWGVRGMLDRVNGMFAFAIWDRKERELTLARDRMGIKPLYWGQFGDLLIFGSELKALRAHPGWQPEVDEQALADFFRYLYVPSPRSVYKGVRKLPPGTLLTFGGDKASETKTHTYWSLSDAVRAGCNQRLEARPEALIEEFDALLGDVVAQQMLADVPVGAFLSGGIDSSSVVAQMQRRAKGSARTFSIGYHEVGFDEAVHAKAVSEHLGTEHTELYVSAADALSVVPRLPELYDEPYADASQVPTALVSCLARSQVTVALSGDGGDELFGGYDRYWNTLDAWHRQSWLPRPIARNLARGIDLFSVDTWERVFAPLPRRFRLLRDPRKSIPYLLEMLRSRHIDLLHQRMIQSSEEALITSGRSLSNSAPWAHREEPSTHDSMERMTYFDSVSLLADGLLTKVDRASMAASLEVRVPLLDHQMVEFVWRLPWSLRFRRNETKWLLRQVLYRHVPPILIDRPKVGFHLPLREWLAGPLRDWAESLLSPVALSADGFLDADRVRFLWRNVVNGSVNSPTPIWAVLMYLAWRDRWLSSRQPDVPSASYGQAGGIHRAGEPVSNRS